MLDRLQKPFLTVETGEAYQPIRLSYALHEKEALVNILNALKCCEKNPSATSWNWFWKEECADIHFESLESFKKNPEQPLRLGTISLRDGALYINLPSFKRACLAVPFFHNQLKANIAKINKADFLNKVFGLNERLTHGLADIFKEEELEEIVKHRTEEYEKAQSLCEQAETPEEALAIIAEYAKRETEKRLPYAERYTFSERDEEDPDVMFLGFYIFLRGRELVAIRRWYGETDYTLAQAADETMEHVFGGMNIDIIE